MIKPIIRFYPALLLLLLGFSSNAQKLLPEPLYGAYAVGFKSVFTYDLARTSVPEVAFSGAIKPLAQDKGRQIQLSVWYPAKAGAASRKALVYEDYVGLLAQEVEFSALDAARKKAAQQLCLEHFQMLGADSSLTLTRLETLFKLSAMARRDAPFAEGQFPLLLFPGTPATQSVMAEFLASHGYIVAVLPFKGTYSSAMEISAQGMETAVDDLQFATQLVHEQFPTDHKNVAVMGLGFNATPCVAYQNRHPGIKAMVSLEGGILSDFEHQMLLKSPFFDPAKITVPLLAIYAPHPSIAPAVIDDFKYCPRRFLFFPGMTEFYFLNFGMFEFLIPGIIGKAPGDVKTGFEWASRYCLQFLNATLKNQESGKAFLKNPLSANGVPDRLIESDEKPGLPAPPGLMETQHLLATGGLPAFIQVYETLKKADTQPFSQEFFLNLYNWLSWKRDDDFKIRKGIMEIRTESYPHSARASYTLAHLFSQTGDIESAKKQFTKTLELLKTDTDPDLTDSMRERIRANSEASLNNLK